MTLQQLREQAGLKITQLARKANVSPATIYKVVNGEQITIEMAWRIARALDTTPDQIEGMKYA